MQRFREGDRVRIDTADKDDPDFDPWHGCEGVVVDVRQDNAGIETGDERDSVDYVVTFGDGEQMHLRWRDLRPLPSD